MVWWRKGGKLDLVTIGAPGYRIEERGADSRILRAPTNDLVQVSRFDLPPDIGASLDDLAALRAAYRARIALGGLGVVAIDVVTVATVRAVRLIVKAPMAPRGRIYLGSITLPFRDFSYVLKVQCHEHGPTGLREAMVMAKGPIELDAATGAPVGWFTDPYEPEARGPLVRNKSDDEAYDDVFPEHPLSRARAVLDDIERTLVVDPKVRGAAPYAHGG